MSLYDDLDDFPSSAAPSSSIPAPPNEPEKKKSDTGAASANITMKFLQSQMQKKRPAPQTSSRPSGAPPVADLSTRRITNLIRPIKAVPITEQSTPMFIPKTALEEKVTMFGEIELENEYNPSQPNDFITHKRKKDEREAKAKIAKEIADRLAKEHRDEEKKREKGAAIAPPTALIDSTPPTQSFAPPPSSTAVFKPPSFLPNLAGSGSSKGLGVAANIMSKFGYKQGSGLGRAGQGVTEAISVEKVGRAGGVISGEETKMVPPSMGGVPAPPGAGGVPAVGGGGVNMAEAMKTATKILMLTNMVVPQDVDSELEGEIREEMSKYGQVASVAVHTISSAPEDEAVRIFVEFTNQAQAIKAFIVLNGRFFGGRAIRAKFYPVDDFTSKNFEK